MKIAITSMGDNLDSFVSERFGRAPYFIIYDTETQKFIPHKNNADLLSGGAGPEAVRQIYSYGVDVILTGNLGGNAASAIESSGMKVVTGFKGTQKVKNAIEEYIASLKK